MSFSFKSSLTNNSTLLIRSSYEFICDIKFNDTLQKNFCLLYTHRQTDGQNIYRTDAQI